MPISLSGQVGDSRFRVHPYVQFNPENLPMRQRDVDVHAIDEHEDHHHPHEKEEGHDDDHGDLPPLTGAVSYLVEEDNRKKTPATLSKEDLLMDVASSLRSMYKPLSDEDISKLLLSTGLGAAAVESLALGGGYALAGGGVLAAAPAWAPVAAVGAVAGAVLYNLRGGKQGRSGESSDRSKKEEKPEHRTSQNSGEKSPGQIIFPDERLRLEDIKVGNQININRFSDKTRGISKDPDTNFDIRPDRARNSGAGGHGGSYWKLYYDGKPWATLDSDGRILRLYK